MRIFDTSARYQSGIQKKINKLVTFRFVYEDAVFVNFKLFYP